MPHDITELYAWLATHADGSEGIIASILPGLGSTPLITSRRHVAEAMKDVAKVAAMFATGEPGGDVKSIRLAKFRLVDE